MLLGLMCRLQGSKDNGLKKQLALGEHYSGFGTTYAAPQQREYYFIEGPSQLCYFMKYVT